MGQRTIAMCPMEKGAVFSKTNSLNIRDYVKVGNEEPSVLADQLWL